MHREIINPPQGKEVDHRNSNGLDNRRENLRVCSHMENTRSRRKELGDRVTSRFKGVSTRIHTKRVIVNHCCKRIVRHTAYEATIKVDGGTVRLGQFDDEERAARQYDRAARVMFGEFALTNEMLGLFAPQGPCDTDGKPYNPYI